MIPLSILVLMDSSVNFLKCSSDCVSPLLIALHRLQGRWSQAVWPRLAVPLLVTAQPNTGRHQEGGCLRSEDFSHWSHLD